MTDSAILTETSPPCLDVAFCYALSDAPPILLEAGEGIENFLGFLKSGFLEGRITLPQRIHSDDQDIAAALFSPEQLPAEGVFNLRVRQADGHIRCCKALYTKIPEPGRCLLKLRLQDAKSLPRTLSDAALTANFRAMMENTNDFIYFKDRNHVLTGASQTLAAICAPAEHWTDLLGQTDYDIFPEEYADAYYRLEKQVFAGIPVAQEVQGYVTKDGKQGWVDNRKYPIRDDSGEIIGLFGIARDITEQRRIESVLLNIANFVAQDHGERIFHAMAEFSARQFEADYVHIALLEPSQTEVRVVAAQLDGKRLDPGYVYALAGTPCENVMQRAHKCYANHVQQLFPADHDLVDLNAESYIGEPIVDSSGQVLGLIVLVSRRPLTDSEDIASGLRILAARAAADQSLILHAQALRASEHLLSTVIGEMPDVLVLKDEKGDFLLCNKTVAKLYNTTPEAMVGKHDGDFGVPTEMANFFRENVLAIMARGETEIVFEDTRDAATGETRHFKSIKRPFKDESGNNRILVIAHDITDVIRAQEKVAASEQLMRNVLDIAQEGIWDWHVPSGRVTHNVRWYQVLNFQKGEVPETVDAFSELLHPDDRPQVLARIEQLLQGKIDTYQSEHRLRDRNGRYLWVRDRGRVVERDAEGKPLRVVGSFFDNTPQFEAEQALRREQERLRLIVDHAPIGIWLQDGTGKMSFVNRAFCEAMGIAEDRFLAAPHYAELMPEEFRPQCLASDAKALASRDVSVTHQRLPFVDGKIHDLRVIKAVRRDADGQPLALVGLSLDITEERQHENALRASEARLKQAERMAKLGNWELDIPANRLSWSDEVFRIFEIDREFFPASYEAFLNAIHPDDREAVHQAFMQSQVNRQPYSIDHRLLMTDGRIKYVHEQCNTDFDADGKPQVSRGTVQDITDQKQNELELDRHVKYNTIMQRLAATLINLPPTQANDALNAALAQVGEFFGADRAYVFDYDLAGGSASNTLEWCAPGIEPQRDALQNLPIDAIPDWYAQHQRGEALVIPSVQALPPGALRDILEPQRICSLIAVPVMSGGTCLGFVGLDAVRQARQFGKAEADLLGLFAELQANLFERTKVELALRETADRLDMATQAAGIGIWDMNMDTGKAYHSRQMASMLDYTDRELGANWEDWAKIVHPDDVASLQQQIAALADAPDAPYHATFRVRAKDGSEHWIESRGRVVEHRNGKLVRMTGTHLDITERRNYQQQLEHIAHYDSLTGLPNRMLLADRLHQAMLQVQRHERIIAVAYIDLDGFKAINDQYGHDTGDLLLSSVADHMKCALREGDTLARLGGDEFVAILRDLTDVESTAPLLTRLLTAASEVFHKDGHLLRVSASLGVTFYPQAEPVDADQLLRQGDQAMYQAKLAGKNRYHIFDIEQDRSVRGHHESLERIRQALNEREFVLYYQPKVNMRTGDVIGVEALIRWRHPVRGLLPPGVFLPLIADHPMAIDIGEWVLETAMTQLETWKAAGLSLPISVNIDAIQLEQNDFVERLRQRMAAHPGLAAGDLELEVLETSALIDFDHVTGVILACDAMGIDFVLDDFGTGYSSLTYLKQLPTSALKIDQSFVRDMLDDPDDLAILKGVLGLAQAFNRRVIAEGVETYAHGEMLLQLGCELAQGYAIARPMPAQELPGWVLTWATPPSWQASPMAVRLQPPGSSRSRLSP